MSQNIFSGINQPNVTFCLDISGSMYSSLDTIKAQLVEHLFEQSTSSNASNRHFNVIAFSTEVYPWSNGMVPWSGGVTVNSAVNWLNELESKTGTNTLGALTSALKDERCDCVCLVTDDLSDQEPYVVLNHVSQMARGSD